MLNGAGADLLDGWPPGARGFAVRDDDGRVLSGALAFHLDGDCEIGFVATDPAARRRGLARQVLAALLADAVTAGCTTATLHATAGRRAALRRRGLPRPRPHDRAVAAGAMTPPPERRDPPRGARHVAGWERFAAGLVGRWAAFATRAPCASVELVGEATAAIFPAAPTREIFNNALLAHGAADPAATLSALRRAYARAGVARFAALAARRRPRRPRRRGRSPAGARPTPRPR